MWLCMLSQGHDKKLSVKAPEALFVIFYPFSKHRYSSQRNRTKCPHMLLILYVGFPVQDFWPMREQQVGAWQVFYMVEMCICTAFLIQHYNICLSFTTSHTAVSSLLFWPLGVIRGLLSFSRTLKYVDRRSRAQTVNHVINGWLTLQITSK